MKAEGAPQGTPGNGGGRKRADLQLRVPEPLTAGTYANSMMVHHTADEFIMDFAMIMGGKGQVVARVITSPTHMKHIMEALGENVRKYESAHGPIEPRALDE